MTDSVTVTSAAADTRIDPRVIGATGGSGTRVVGRIVRAAGMYIGSNLNEYQDALDLGAYSDRWINDFVRNGRIEGLAAGTRERMRRDLGETLEAHRRDQPADASAWGWKEPRSIYLLPFFNEALPEMRFVHWLRDGRDMAFSENQQQLRKHGRAVLGLGRLTPERSIRLWTTVNTWAADFGEREMPGRYLRVRFEDLCAQPVETVTKLYEFFGLDGDVERAAQEVRPPSSLGRWRDERPRTLAKLHEIAAPALERFGYAPD